MNDSQLTYSQLYETTIKELNQKIFNNLFPLIFSSTFIQDYKNNNLPNIDFLTFKEGNYLYDKYIKVSFSTFLNFLNSNVCPFDILEKLDFIDLSREEIDIEYIKENILKIRSINFNRGVLTIPFKRIGRNKNITFEEILENEEYFYNCLTDILIEKIKNMSFDEIKKSVDTIKELGYSNFILENRNITFDFLIENGILKKHGFSFNYDMPWITEEVILNNIHMPWDFSLLSKKEFLKKPKTELIAILRGIGIEIKVDYTENKRISYLNGSLKVTDNNSLNDFIYNGFNGYIELYIKSLQEWNIQGDTTNHIGKIYESCSFNNGDLSNETIEEYMKINKEKIERELKNKIKLENERQNKTELEIKKSEKIIEEEFLELQKERLKKVFDLLSCGEINYDYIEIKTDHFRLCRDYYFCLEEALESTEGCLLKIKENHYRLKFEKLKKYIEDLEKNNRIDRIKKNKTKEENKKRKWMNSINSLKV
jgi:hypothetical protein